MWGKDSFLSAEALAGAADNALYAARRQGRNRALLHIGPGCPADSIRIEATGIPVA
jgi:hypothetical protein